MKKTIKSIMILMISISLVACSNNKPSKTNSSSSNSVIDVIENQMNNSNQDQKQNENKDNKTSDTKPKKEKTLVDVDLTNLSKTFVYSEVNNMMIDPLSYVGKSIRMKGPFAIYQSLDEKGEIIPDLIYFACIIEDATACCAQGLEFVLDGNYKYPQDYPEIGSQITVSGIFELYDENGHTYCHLVNAVLE